MILCLVGQIDEAAVNRFPVNEKGVDGLRPAQTKRPWVGDDFDDGGIPSARRLAEARRGEHREGKNQPPGHRRSGLSEGARPDYSAEAGWASRNNPLG